jgi:integrase
VDWAAASLKILGHSRITLTMDTYSHVMPSVMNDAAAKMDAVLSANA